MLRGSFRTTSWWPKASTDGYSPVLTLCLPGARTRLNAEQHRGYWCAKVPIGSALLATRQLTLARAGKHWVSDHRFNFKLTENVASKALRETLFLGLLLTHVSCTRTALYSLTSELENVVLDTVHDVVSTFGSRPVSRWFY